MDSWHRVHVKSTEYVPNVVKNQVKMDKSSPINVPPLIRDRSYTVITVSSVYPYFLESSIKIPMESPPKRWDKLLSSGLAIS